MVRWIFWREGYDKYWIAFDEAPWVANHDKNNNDSEDGCGGDDVGAIV